MNIIGVELHLPSRRDHKALAMFVMFIVAGGAFMVAVGLVEALPASSLAFGIIVGSLANACGCSVRRHGFRGFVVLSGIFLIALVLYLSMILIWVSVQ